MPIYTYLCTNCKETLEQIRKIADRDLVTVCNRCRRPADRQIDAPGMVWSPTSTGGGMKV